MKYLTITVPCFNSEKYLRRCLDSLMIGGNDVEIIVVDDGSTDQTGEIADLYAKWFPEIVTVVHQENSGHGSGVNTGLKLAKGRYFKVVDSDDWLEKTAYRELLKRIKTWEGLEKTKYSVGCGNICSHYDVHILERFSEPEYGGYNSRCQNDANTLSCGGSRPVSFLCSRRRQYDLLSAEGSRREGKTAALYCLFIHWLFLFRYHTICNRRTADAAILYEKRRTSHFCIHCGIDDHSGCL